MERDKDVGCIEERLDRFLASPSWILQHDTRIVQPEIRIWISI